MKLTATAGVSVLLACLLPSLPAPGGGAARPSRDRVSASQAPPPQASGPIIEIDMPPDGSYVSGPLVLKARLVPSSQRVERLTFYTDGRVACVLERPPFECAWDSGPNVSEHQVRVVAQLPGGAVIRRVVRTKGVEYAEAVDVEAIQVTATVTNDDGEFVRNLRRESFRVFENDVPQAITSFMAENIPLEIVVAVDFSGSMIEAMPQVRLAVKKFLSSLRPQDKVTLLAFNDNVVTLARPTVDLAARLKAVDRLSAWGGTVFYEVILRSLAMQTRQTGRRAVVMFTDGEDRNSHVGLADTEARLETSDSMLYIIGLGQAAESATLRAVIERLSRRSGGRSFFAESAAKLDDPFRIIVEELSNQYFFCYLPKNDRKDGTWRNIRVELDDKRYKVRARQGYRAVPKTERGR